MKEEFKKLIHEALQKSQARNLDIYTFALYHDHESHVATACIDTLENSTRSVVSQNEYNRSHFYKAIEANDIKTASMWCANIGRSLSLGDFVLVNASEIDVPKRPKNPEFYLNMVLAIKEMNELIQRQSNHGSHLVYCCSTAESEVGLVWS